MDRFKVGDIVVANEKSIGRYTITTKSNGYVGRVIEVNRKDIKLKSISSIATGCKGCYWVEAECFDLRVEPKERKTLLTEKKDMEVTRPEEYMFGVNAGSMGIICDDRCSKVLFNGRTGVALRNKSDKYDESFGILLATARVLGLEKGFVNKMVDAFYEKHDKIEIKLEKETTLKDASVDELMNELKNRIK